MSSQRIVLLLFVGLGLLAAFCVGYAIIPDKINADTGILPPSGQEMSSVSLADGSDAALSASTPTSASAAAPESVALLAGTHVPEPPVSASPGQSPPQNAAQEQSVPPAPAPAKKNILPVKIAPRAEQKEYSGALAAYNAHQPADAIRQFDTFITTYPDSALMPNALYWKGECLYLQGKNPDAIFLFKDVVARFPRHPKAADALLKIGMAYARLKDTDNARLHYQILLEDYPKSQVARKAKTLLGK